MHEKVPLNNNKDFTQDLDYSEGKEAGLEGSVRGEKSKNDVEIADERVIEFNTYDHKGEPEKERIIVRNLGIKNRIISILDNRAAKLSREIESLLQESDQKHKLKICVFKRIASLLRELSAEVENVERVTQWALTVNPQGEISLGQDLEMNKLVGYKRPPFGVYRRYDGCDGAGFFWRIEFIGDDTLDDEITAYIQHEIDYVYRISEEAMDETNIVNVVKQLEESFHKGDTTRRPDIKFGYHWKNLFDNKAFLKLLENKPLTDLGAGDIGDLAIELATKAGSSEVNNVDIEGNEFDSMQEINKGIHYHRKDFLLFLKSLSDDYGNFMINGIDSAIIGSEKYLDYLAYHLFRCTSIGGIVFGINSPFLRKLEHYGFKRIDNRTVNIPNSLYEIYQKQ